MMRPRSAFAITATAVAALLIPTCSAASASALADVTVTAAHASRTDYLAKHYQSIAAVRKAVTSRKESAVSVAKSYLHVIDEKEGTVNALITLDPRALQRAKALDKRIAAGKKVGALAGVPFVVKDNMDVQGLPTTGGSIGLANNYPTTTAPVVQRLLDQDAILLGKTNMSELAASYGRLGYSSEGGLTLNPANTKRNASGSSSGTAAAVASGMAVFGLGTDTSGSVRGPASVTGMVGLRPTHGVLPSSGIIPLSLSFDTVGAITSSVKDQAAVDAVLANPGAAVKSTVENLHGVKHLKVGVIRAFTGGDPEVDHAMNRTLRKLRSDGVGVQNVTVPDSFTDLFTSVLGPVGDAEFASQFEQYLAGSPDSAIKTLPQLIAFYESSGAAKAVNPVNPARLEGLKTAEAKRDTLSSPEVQAILTTTIPELRQQVRAILDRDHLDALVFPTLSCVASPRYDINDPAYTCKSGDPYTGSYLASATGFPEATVPIDEDSAGLPIGLSFLGDDFTERRLLGLGSLVAERR